MDGVERNVSFEGAPGEALWGATLGFFIGFAAVSLFGPTAHRFQEVMDLSPTLVGLLVAIPMLTGSLLRIPFSAWVDTTGGRKPFLILLVLSIIGMVGLLLMFEFLYPARLTADWYPLVLLFGALAGCGIAIFSVGISQVSYWFPQERQGWALGTYAGLGNTAPGLISFALPLVIGAWGLGGTYLAWLAILIVGTLLYAYMGRNAWYFQLREHGYGAEEARRRAEREGAGVVPPGVGQGGAGSLRAGVEDVGAGRALLHHLRRIPRTDGVAADLLAELSRFLGEDGRRAHRGLLPARLVHPDSGRIVVGPLRRRAGAGAGHAESAGRCRDHDVLG